MSEAQEGWGVEIWGDSPWGGTGDPVRRRSGHGPTRTFLAALAFITFGGAF